MPCLWRVRLCAEMGKAEHFHGRAGLVLVLAARGFALGELGAHPGRRAAVLSLVVGGIFDCQTSRL